MGPYEIIVIALCSRDFYQCLCLQMMLFCQILPFISWCETLKLVLLFMTLWGYLAHILLKSFSPTFSLLDSDVFPIMSKESLHFTSLHFFSLLSSSPPISSLPLLFFSLFLFLSLSANHKVFKYKDDILYHFIAHVYTVPNTPKASKECM